MPTKPRKHLSLKTKLAAMILAWDRRGVRQILYEEAKRWTADQIIRLVEFDHYPIRHADGGPDEPWNLEPRLVRDHREKTKRDAKDMAHERKVRRAEDEHRRRMLAPLSDYELRPSRWYKPKRKMQSRPWGR